jgi:hypothetical protein
MFNVAMIVPTGIGCEIGGHAGDATPSSRLLGLVCDKLILHPNVVNASDINEMPSNALYVEGSILDRFLEGQIELQEVKSNEILVVVNKPVKPETINAISAARATLGARVMLMEMKVPLRMVGRMENGKATGDVFGWKELCSQVIDYKFDVLAIASEIEVSRKLAKLYFKNGGINPWGGVEAKASRLISTSLNRPVAHAPIQCDEAVEEYGNGDWNFVCDPRMSAEIVSMCYIHCVLKGLHKAPRIGKGLSNKDVDVMVSPMCWGRPHVACEKAGIPIIIVKENKTVCEFPYGHHKVIFVKNYLEAAGVISAMRGGITLESIQRPLKHTEVINA